MTVGFDIDSFWDQTPRTVFIGIQGKNEAARIAHNQRAWAAYHTASWQRSKKMPSYRSVVMNKRPPAQSVEQQYAIMEKWAEVRNKRLANG